VCCSSYRPSTPKIRDSMRKMHSELSAIKGMEMVSDTVFAAAVSIPSHKKGAIRILTRILLRACVSSLVFSGGECPVF